MPRYIVATIKPWNLAAYERWARKAAGNWSLVQTQDELDEALSRDPLPRYVFFPHWSSKVPSDIHRRAECVCFHMTDLPFGRGSSPLQNLIERGHRHTMISAIKMTEELDAGPIYAKEPLSLLGSAQEIFERTADLVFQMIGEIVQQEPKPVPQIGDVTHFKRRTPGQSRLPENAEMTVLYDHIRMLDAETYPPAFLEVGAHRYEFADAHLEGDTLFASVTIRRKIQK